MTEKQEFYVAAPCKDFRGNKSKFKKYAKIAFKRAGCDPSTMGDVETYTRADEENLQYFHVRAYQY